MAHPAASALALDRADGLPTFDGVGGYAPPRLRVLWLENRLDCRTWTYYCDLRSAMARLHELCTPVRGVTCLEGEQQYDLAVVGPRYACSGCTYAAPTN